MSSTSNSFDLPASDAGTDSKRAREFKVIALIAVAHFVSHVHIMLLPPLFGEVREAFGVSYVEIGFALTAFNAASALLQTPAGFLVDRVGPRAMLTGGLILGGAAVAAAALLPGYWFFVIAYGFLGLANTVYHPADYSILSATIDHKRIGKAFSIHTFAGYLGSGVTPALALACAAMWGWRGAFLFVAGLSIATALLLIVAGSVLPRVVHKPSQAASEGQRPEGRPRPPAERADPAQPAVLLLPSHGQWRHPDIHGRGPGADPRHAVLGRQRRTLGFPAVQRRRACCWAASSPTARRTTSAWRPSASPAPRPWRS
jgi:MFS family permease